MSFAKVTRTNVLILRLCGMISFPEKTIRSRICTYVLRMIAVGSLVFHAYSYVRQFVINAGHLDTVVETVSMIVTLVGALVHYAIVYVRRDEIQAMLDSLEDLWQPLDATEQRCVASFLRKVEIFSYFFLSQCCTAMSFYSTAAGLASGKPISNSTMTTRALPYPNFMETVPKSPYWQALFFLQVSSMFNIGITCVAIEMMSPMVIMLASGYFRVLQQQFDAMGRRFNDSTIKNLDTMVSKHLALCINRHWQIFSICEDIGNLTDVIFLIKLLCTTVILATAGFKMVGDNTDKYKYFPQIIIGLVQLFIANWPPDVLMSESVAVANAVYGLPWYQWPCEVGKSVQIVMARSQRTVQLTAGKVVIMSFETFSSVVSSALSLLAALRTVQ